MRWAALMTSWSLSKALQCFLAATPIKWSRDHEHYEGLVIDGQTSSGYAQRERLNLSAKFEILLHSHRTNSRSTKTKYFPTCYITYYISSQSRIWFTIAPIYRRAFVPSTVIGVLRALHYLLLTTYKRSFSRVFLKLFFELKVSTIYLTTGSYRRKRRSPVKSFPFPPLFRQLEVHVGKEGILSREVESWL